MRSPGTSVPAPRRRIAGSRAGSRGLGLAAGCLSEPGTTDPAVLRQLEVGAGVLALGGEVVAEGRWSWPPGARRLERRRVHLAATGVRISLSGQTNRAIARIFTHRVGKLPGVLVGRAVEGHQEVDRDRGPRPRAARGNSASTSCSSVSPSPAIRPGKQGGQPGRQPCPMVSTRSSYVWVCTILVVVGLGGVDVVVVGVDPGLARSHRPGRPGAAEGRRRPRRRGARSSAPGR